MTVSSTETGTAALARAAFGDNPGRWPLPAATTPHASWLRAVVAGGQGRYASAQTDLAALCRTQRRGPVVSLALSTRASFLRQLGWHVRARGWDGQALAQAGSNAEALADALTGLAADALGVGRFAASARLLQQATDHVAGGAPNRLAIRLAWVAAELAMARGEGAAAVDHAQRAVELAAAFGSARHAVKSDVILAAALCTAGAVQRSRELADATLRATDQLGLVPLRWALASLLIGIGSAVHPPPAVLDIRDRSAEIVRLRGGVWSGR
jgi:hypothetical protein